MAAEFLTIDYVFHTLRERLHEVEKAYQTKLEAREHKGEVLELLREIKSDLKEVNDKLDRKADK